MKKTYKKQLTTVTGFSKFLATAIFIILVFGSFFLGMKLNDQNKNKTPKKQDSQIQTKSTAENELEDDEFKKYTFEGLGLSLTVPVSFIVTFEPQLNLDTNMPYAYTFTIQNYQNSPTAENNYQLYGTYQFDVEKVDSSVLPELRKEMNEDTAEKKFIKDLPAIQGQLRGERQRWVTYIIKDGYILRLFTSEPTEENRLITENIISTFEFE